MDNEQFCELASRSLIGDFRNMSNDCIENLRPRAQYMHFYRESRKKLVRLLSNWSIPVNNYYNALNDILSILNSIKANHDNQIELSQSILNILNNYNLNYAKPKSDTRDIGF